VKAEKPKHVKARTKAQAHLLDAIVASSVLLIFAIACMGLLSRPPLAPPPEPPSDALAVLAQDPSFVRAVYQLDSASLAQHVRAVVGSKPFKLVVCDSAGSQLLKVGEDVEGIAAVVVLSGYNGDVSPRYVSLVVKC
jgi:hypothetical protein